MVFPRMLPTLLAGRQPLPPDAFSRGGPCCEVGAKPWDRVLGSDLEVKHLKREEAGYNADLRIFQKHLQWFTQQRAFKQGREYALETQPKMQQEADDELFSKSFEEVLRETKLEGATPPER